MDEQGVSTPVCCISRMRPYESYNTANVSSFLRTAGVMAAYSNTLAITVANGLVNGRDHLNVTPVLKAVIRDLKRHLARSSETTGTRTIPVGYSSACVPPINLTPGFIEYLYSGDKETTVDFWAVSHFDTSAQASGS